MDRQAAPIRQVGQHRVRYAAEAHLQRRAIVDQPRHVPGNLLGHSVCRVVHVLGHRAVDEDEPTNSFRRDAAVPLRARHVGVDLRNDLASRECGRLRHVDRDAEAASTVRVGRSDLHERDVERDPLVAEQLGHVRLLDEAVSSDHTEDSLPELADLDLVLVRHVRNLVGHDRQKDHPLVEDLVVLQVVKERQRNAVERAVHEDGRPGHAGRRPFRDRLEEGGVGESAFRDPIEEDPPSAPPCRHHREHRPAACRGLDVEVVDQAAAAGQPQP